MDRINFHQRLENIARFDPLLLPLWGIQLLAQNSYGGTSACHATGNRCSNLSGKLIRAEKRAGSGLPRRSIFPVGSVHGRRAANDQMRRQL
jgi:hypothetical protein